MALLSDTDIKKELGRNIFIYPLDLDNLKGSSINLRASKLAWSLSLEKSTFDVSNNEIIIPAHDTVLVETEETLFVTNKISGSYHSRVNLVSKGIGHIGTTLDPEWVGPSLIALHNTSKLEKRINVGDSIVSIMFYYLKSKSIKKNTNTAGRPELLNDFRLSDEEKHWLDEEWRKDSNKLKEKLVNSKEYKKLLKERINKYQRFTNPWTVNILCLFICFLAGIVLYNYKNIFSFETKDFAVPIICVYLSILTTQIIRILYK